MNRGPNDLDRLDRVTIRAWRSMNLIGWGAVGAAVTFLLSRVTNLVAERLSESSTMAANRIGFVSILVSGAAGGLVVGARVYRSPGLVAFLGQELAVVVWLAIRALGDGQSWGVQEVAIQFVFSLLIVLPAVLVARIVWRHRPAALRAPA
jgi:hypothetical protein